MRAALVVFVVVTDIYQTFNIKKIKVARKKRKTLIVCRSKCTNLSYAFSLKKKANITNVFLYSQIHHVI